MGAFLTLTADSLSTSPIHRAVYVMEKFLGIRPPPPPADVEIAEPDVRQAKTIKEILAAHTTDPTCASCHRSIDPYGYAFENFDPTGAWRDEYTMHIAAKPSREALLEIEKQNRQRAARGLAPAERRWERAPIPIDAASRFPDGAPYGGIVEYRSPPARRRVPRPLRPLLHTQAADLRERQRSRRFAGNREYPGEVRGERLPDSRHDRSRNRQSAVPRIGAAPRSSCFCGRSLPILPPTLHLLRRPSPGFFSRRLARSGL